MRKTLDSVYSGVGTITSTVSTTITGVGQLSSAVSTTMLNLASEDTDLTEFGDGDFAKDLRGRLDQELRRSKRKKKRKKEKELSVDSGVATEPLNDQGCMTDHTMQASPRHVATPCHTADPPLRQMSCSSISSLSLSSDEDFVNGLNFLNLDTQESAGKDEITAVTDDDILTTSDSEQDEFSLGSIDITSTEVFQARRRHESADSHRTLGHRSLVLNNSGNLSDLRRSFNDLSLTPRPLSSAARSKSTTTLSPGTDDTIITRRLLSSDHVISSSPDHVISSSPDNVIRSAQSELALNTIREYSDPQEQINSLHHDPTTIESFDSSSPESADEYLKEIVQDNTLSGFDEDDDLLEKKDPFRESFLAPTNPHPLTVNQLPDHHSPVECVKRKTFSNFNVGTSSAPPRAARPAADLKTEHSVIETISEITSTRSHNKSTSISRKTPVNLKPLPKIAQPKRVATLAQKFEKPVAGKRKNILSPPSSSQAKKNSVSKTVTKDSPRSVSKTVTKDNPRSVSKTLPKDSPRSVSKTLPKDSPRSARSTSCTNLNSRTDEPLSRSGTLDGFNSLDKTRSYADLTFTPVHFATESSPTVDVAEHSVTQNTQVNMSSSLGQQQQQQQLHKNSMTGAEKKISTASTSTTESSSTFYSFSSDGDGSRVILNGKSNKSFMVSMRNSFKKLASFLSLSKRKLDQVIVPVPPPAHTRPYQGKSAGKYRQCVPPPDLEQEFRQRTAASCGNLAPTTLHKPSAQQDPGNVDKVPRKRLVAPSSLISHISSHYQEPPPSKSAVRQRTPYKSSPSTLLPSPPTQRKPVWRETKSSRLRLNRVKAPSMSALNL